MKLFPVLPGPLHFVGIGGIGMSGIAEILHDLGYPVQGSDSADGANVRRLRARGIRVCSGHDTAHVRGLKGEPAAALVLSSAIRADNPEWIEARRLRIPVLHRADMLAEIMRLKWSVAISGTHGKTTTTTMIGALFDAAGQDPTIINGGIILDYGSNTRLGRGDWMIVEADESDGSFTRLPATLAVVTNIDPEHLDHYGSFEAVRAAYRTYLARVPFYGRAIVCADHPVTRALAQTLDTCRPMTYGESADADVRIANVRTHATGFDFDLHLPDQSVMRDMSLPLCGRHNVLNAAAALAVGFERGLDRPAMRRALAGFSGVKRRFTQMGTINGAWIIDDYAHHPVEVRAVLQAARQRLSESGGRLHAVFQPHRFTRLRDLFDDFSQAFDQADMITLVDVYPAGEPALIGIDHQALALQMQRRQVPCVRAASLDDALALQLKDQLRPGDGCVLMGAGSISAWTQALPYDVHDRADDGLRQDAPVRGGAHG